MPGKLQQYLSGKLEQRLQLGNKRSLFTPVAGVDFYSNDYLGIAKQTFCNELPHGSTGSRLLSGNSIAATELEAFLAGFHQAEAALLFNSGYDANLGLLSCLADRHCTIIYDEYAHASIIDGARLSMAKQVAKFRHNDLEHLEQLLQKLASPGQVFIVVESVYSMEGDKAPLRDLVSLAARFDAAVIVDEAHATGVYGPDGAGLVQAMHLQEQVFARVHTFGKALGCHGAVVTGSRLLIDYLINFARSFIYTTALPPHAISVAQKAYQYMLEHPQNIVRLNQNISRFNELKKNITGASWLESDSAIQCLVTGSNDTVRSLKNLLLQHQILVSAVMHPTVPAGKERLRICLHTFNTLEEMSQLHDIINNYLC